MSNSKTATILIIDDDNFTLKVVNRILLNGLHVSYIMSQADSGEKGLKIMETQDVDLVLVDVVMPGIDGMEVLRRIRAMEKYRTVPVILMSATMSQELEAEAFRNGATDFIHKPFAPEVITLRLEQHLRLAYLQDNLKAEVKRQTEQISNLLASNERLLSETVAALASTIDAKDPYTKGHSVRVAMYSRSISHLAGDPKEVSDQIYLIAMLHDIGKIGVPYNVINKPDRLTDEEYEIMKAHTTIGAQILSLIKANPKLSIGAHYHHERYDGKGYPEGLAGNDIPREARIICVADTYDSMTSRRSYRDVLPQKTVREQMEEGIGTQFDPEFARCMLKLIDMDTDYRMRQDYGEKQ